ncbi:MAG: RluA family pseudouridine synthase [Bacilli bacterium]|nr:RluA family pseudouridine synthase [Bacilli bacterium]
MKEIKANKELAGLRLDKALSLILEDVSRSKVQSHLENGLILVNQKKEKPSYKLSDGDVITIEDFPSEVSDLNPEDIPLDIVYEDDDLIVVNKPKGLVVHPGAGNEEHTLANALKFHSDNLSTLNGEFRPGIVHRIDKDTAGLLIVAKNDAAHAFLSNQLADHTLGRKYYALVLGVIPENEGKIIAPIGRDQKFRQKMAVDLLRGKEAETNFKVIERFKESTLVECALKTGRTHQIRVHMAYIGYPVIGDPIYGKGNRKMYDEGQLLFAHEIHFIHPKTKKEMTFSVDLPDYFKEILQKLR